MSQAPTTLSDVEVLLGGEATKLLSFRQEGDKVIAKPKAWMEHDVFLSFLNRVRELGGSYDQPNRQFIIPLSKASLNTSGTPTTSGTAVCTVCGKPIGSEAYTYVSGQPVHVACAKPAPTPTPRKEGFDIVPVASILGFPYTLRLSLDEDEEFQGLTATVQAYGVLEPLIVRPKPDGVLELVCGDRRLRAAKKAGLLEVPVVIRELDDKAAKKLQFIENLQRRNLTAYEIAIRLKELLVEYREQREMAEDLGKSQGWISRHLHLLDLDSSLHDYGVIMEKLNLTQAEALLKVPPERRPAFAERIASGKEMTAEQILEEAGVKSELPTEVSTEIPTRTSLPTSIPTDVATPMVAPKPGEWLEPLFHCPICNKDFIIVHIAEGKHRFLKPKGVSGSLKEEGEHEPR